MYIHELKNWPQFSWDAEKVSSLLAQVRHDQGRLIGRMEAIGFYSRSELVLQTLTQDIVKSSEIEGELLDRSQVRSSVARHLRMDIASLVPTDPNVEGVVEMMLDVTRNFSLPLTRERLFHWHSTLFPTGRSGFTKIKAGQWRIGPVQVVSGRLDREMIHFEGPIARRVEEEMSFFLDWLNREKELDLVLKAAIAHLWFVTIHPFDDGNGRIGRAIGDLLLARSENHADRCYSLSAQIQIERKHYYQILEQTQKGNLDITSWIEWFLHCLSRAIEKAGTTLENVKHKEHSWKTLADTNLNSRQRKLQNLLMDGFNGKLTTPKWAKIAKCSQDTAHRDILELVRLGILFKRGEGRNTSYSLNDL